MHWVLQMSWQHQIEWKWACSQRVEQRPGVHLQGPMGQAAAAEQMSALRVPKGAA